jgi:hypothetical protein
MLDIRVECPECFQSFDVIEEDPDNATYVNEFLQSERGTGCAREIEQEFRDLAELAYAQDPKHTEYLLTKLGLRKILRSVEFMSRNR